MSEWEKMAENIRRALDIVEQAHKEGNHLRETPSADSLRRYLESLRLLCNTLGSLKQLLEHETTVLGDEINDVIAQALSGRPAPYRPTPRYPGKRVLIVEDEADTAEMLSEMLSLKGYHVEKIYRAQAAIEYLKHNRPDAIVLDLMMPVTSGLEVLKFVRSHPNLQNVPVVVVSAKSIPSEIQEVMDAGASAYLTKPITYNEFIQTLENLLEPEEEE